MRTPAFGAMGGGGNAHCKSTGRDHPGIEGASGATAQLANAPIDAISSVEIEGRHDGTSTLPLPGASARGIQLHRRLGSGELTQAARLFLAFPPLKRSRQSLADTPTSYFLAAARIFFHALSRSASVTPSTWSNRAMAFRTCLASLSGSFRSSGKAKFASDIRFFWAVLRPLPSFARFFP